MTDTSSHDTAVDSDEDSSARTSGRAWSQRLRDPGFWANWTAAVALVILVVVFGLLSDVFLTPGNIEAILASATILIVLAVGQSFAVLTAGIDLSQGSTVTLAGIVLGMTFAEAGWPIGAAMLAAMAAGALVGLVNGTFVTRVGITDFIVTLGMLSVASGVALVLSDGRPIRVTSTTLLELSVGGIGPVRWSLLLALGVAVLAHLALFHTPFGVHLLSVGGNADASRAMGVDTATVKTVAYMVSGALAGLAGILLVARVGSADPAAATRLLLNSVASVVLGGVSLFGGRGTIAGPVIGAILLSALVNGLTVLGISEFIQPVAVGTVVILSAVLVRYQR